MNEKLIVKVVSKCKWGKPLVNDLLVSGGAQQGLGESLLLFPLLNNLQFLANAIPFLVFNFLS